MQMSSHTQKPAMLEFAAAIVRTVNDMLHPVRLLPPKEAYRLWAPTYDDRSDNAILFAEEHAVLPLLDKLSFKGRNVVDFGCGTGRHILHLLDRGANKVVGIDFSREMLSIGKRAIGSSRAWLVQSNLEETPLVDSIFDIGIASLVLSHIKGLRGVLREICRVLRPNATLLISDLHWSFDSRGWKRTFIAKQSDPSRCAVENITHELSEYHSAFQECGFAVEAQIEPKLDSALRPFFERANMLKTFDRYIGLPLLVVFQLRKV
jgi:malonyl-CoA O-methyltransferase